MIKEYLEYLRSCGLADNTIRSKRAVLMGLDNVVQAKSDELQKYIADESIKAGTRQLRYIHLSTFFKWLLEYGYIFTNPMETVQRPKVPTMLPSRIMTSGEAKRMIEAMDDMNLRDRVMVEIMFSCSLRRSDVVNLNVDDFDPEAMTLKVRYVKTGRVNVVPIGKVAANMLIEYLKEGRPQVEREVAMFLSYRKKRIGAAHLTALVKDLRKKAKIRTKASSQSFRKTSATEMLRNGAPVQSVQALLGHARLSSTLPYTKVYQHDLFKIHRTYHPRERQKNVELPELNT